MGGQPEEVDVPAGARRISKCHIGAEQKRECSHRQDGLGTGSGSQENTRCFLGKETTPIRLSLVSWLTWDEVREPGLGEQLETLGSFK